LDLQDIKFVIDLKYVNEVNRYLQDGWILLKTYTASYDPLIAKDDLTIHYVLGATKDVDYSKELSKLTAYNDLEIGIDLDKINADINSTENEPF
jgi:hypothetical protein